MATTADGAAAAVAEELASATAELNSTTSKKGIPPGQVTSYQCDITDEESVNALVKTVLAAHGHVDVLVNNAGRSIRRSVSASSACRASIGPR